MIKIALQNVYLLKDFTQSLPLFISLKFANPKTEKSENSDKVVLKYALKLVA